MKSDNLHDLPRWDDFRFKPEEDGYEKQARQATTEACRSLYNKWVHIHSMIRGALDTKTKAPVEEKELNESYLEHLSETILCEGFEVAVKIRSSEVGLFIIRMENAAIIRRNAQFISSSLLLLMGVIEEAYIMAIRDEIDQFRELFREWVNTFEKDEILDEWGLFI